MGKSERNLSWVLFSISMLSLACLLLIPGPLYTAIFGGAFIISVLIGNVIFVYRRMISGERISFTYVIVAVIWFTMIIYGYVDAFIYDLPSF